MIEHPFLHDYQPHSLIFARHIHIYTLYTFKFNYQVAQSMYDYDANLEEIVPMEGRSGNLMSLIL